MARKPKGYWEKRQTELLKNIEKATEPTINNLIKIYKKATSNINEEIRKIYKNYSKDSTLSKEVLNQLLNKKESEIHQKNLLKVINNNIKDEELKKKLITKYNAPAYSYRISRLQALQDNIDIELKQIAELEEEITKLRYVNTIDEAYYRNIYDIQKGTGYGFSFSQLDTRTMDMLLRQKWIGNANFSQRIWQNNDRLNQFLKINFTADMMIGKSVSKISKELSQYMNMGLYASTRLVRTEVNHFANISELMAYQECGIEKYQFIATLDKVTCDICANLDKKVFRVKDAKQGVNFPPIHPNDRCTTVAYFDDDIEEGLQRRARDPVTGETYLVDNISYEEWRKQIDNKYGEGTLSKYHKMYNNTSSDKEQYNKYKNVIGNENLPKTFEKYQELKYTNSSEYSLLKSYYRASIENSLPSDMTYSIYKKNLTTDDWQAVGFNPNYIEKHKKHLSEFGNISWEEYENKAKRILNSVDKNVEKFVSKEGTHFAYNKSTNEFALARKNGITQSYYLPTEKEEYWKEQVKKYGEKS